MHPKKSLLFPLLLVFYEITTYLSNDMYLPALPNIAADFNIPQSEAQFSLTSWFLGSASLQLILGPLSDRYGRRPIVLTGGIIFILSTILCAFATDITTLLIARFIEGTAVCSVVTAGYASIHERYDQSQAIRILALMGSVVVIAPTFGPLLGSGILFFSDWRMIFWMIALVSVIAISLLFKFMPETNPLVSRQPIIIHTLIKHYWEVLSNRHFLAYAFMFFQIFCNFIVWLSAAPFIVSNEFGMNTVVFGLSQVFIFFFFIAANRLIKKMLDKIGVNKLINLGLIIACSGTIFTVISAAMFPDFLYGIVIGMAIYAFGAGFTFAPLSRLAIEACAQPMGIRMAIFSTFMSGFGVLGSIFSSLFYQGTLLSFAWIVFAITASACVIRLAQLVSTAS